MAGRGNLREQRTERGGERAGGWCSNAVGPGGAEGRRAAQEAGEAAARGNGGLRVSRLPGSYPVGLVKPLKF